jgi:CheY-like chemotaxis protein
MSRKGTILVVEDEELVRDMIAEELRDAGFHVLEAADGEEASSLLMTDDSTVDVLFTDIRLPGRLDGWAVAQFARQLRGALPVVYATGYTVDRSAEVSGAIFLNKPYQPSFVIETIQKLLNAAPDAQ